MNWWRTFWEAFNLMETNRKVTQTARDLALLDVRMARAEAELQERGVIALAPLDEEATQ